MSRHARHNSRLWFIDVGGIAVLAGLTAAAFSIIVQPLVRERDKIAGERSQLTDASLNAEKMGTDEADLRAQLARIQSDLAASPIQLEPSSRLNQRLARIVDLADATDLVINETRSDRVASGVRYETVPMAISGFGSYPNCIAFLRRLGETLPDVEVMGLDLSNSPSTSGSSPMFSFDLAWYASASRADDS